ncbi:MAG: ribokinase [Prevotella sp.]|nr:ribokinase [Bacteroidales bacterium]MDY3842977.1 ribokinase [Prevotella sp.]
MIREEKSRILVVGSANTDMVISAEHFPLPGETMMGHGFMTNHGGKGANQAVAAARLEGNTAFIGKVGDDQFGHSTIEMMKGEGIDVSGLTVTSEQASGVALITTVPSGENSIIVDSGANGLLRPEDITNAEKLFEDAGIVLMQLETPIDTLTEAAAMAKKHGAYVVLNPAPAPKEPLPVELLKNVDLLIPNETEAAYISGVNIAGDEDLPAAMNEIQKLGVKDVIITVGSRGVCARIDGEMVTVPAFKVKAIDTTAAGDTFCGALCVALSNGKPLVEAIRFGCKASSISVTRRGAQMSMPRLEEIVM